MSDSYRDDHDAALCRITALEEELRRSQHATAAASKLADLSQREADTARRELERERQARPQRTTTTAAEPAKPRRPPVDNVAVWRGPIDPAERARMFRARRASMYVVLVGWLMIIGGGLATSTRDPSEEIGSITVLVLGILLAMFGAVLGVTAHPRS